MGYSRCSQWLLIVLLLISGVCSAQKLPIRIGSGVSDTVWNTWSSTDKFSTCIVYNGNLSYSTPASTFSTGTAVFGKSSGKWYFESRLDTVGGTFEFIGVTNYQATSSSNNQLGALASSIGYRGNAYCVRRNFGAGSASFGSGCTTQSAGMWVGVALDLDAGTINFYVNGTLQVGATLSGIPAGTWRPAYGGGGTRTAGTSNFGQNPWNFAPPSGFVGWYQ